MAEVLAASNWCRLSRLALWCLLLLQNQIGFHRVEAVAVEEQSQDLLGSSNRAAELASLIGAGEQQLASKRARKLSAFMPMRGRKDGREMAGLLGLAPDGGLAAAPMENEGEPSILRLVAAAPLVGGAGFRWADQRRQEPMMGPSVLQTLALTPTTPDKGTGRARSMKLASLESSGPGLNFQYGAPLLMEAKLRRAFHPMRGKKSDPEMLEPEQLGLPDELAELVLSNTQ